MRVSKTITLRFNGDSAKEIECSVEYDGWCFDGTKEECLQEIKDLIDVLETNVREGIG